MRKILTLVAALALAVVPAAGAALAQSGEGRVIVVHGVPDLAVDIYVNGDLTLPGAMYGDVVGPLALPAASYEVDIYAAGADPATDDPALSASADLEADTVATLAAYLQEGGTPTLGVFVENTSTIPAGQGRATAYHLADFGAVDILASGAPVFPGVTNGNSGTLVVPADTYTIQVTAAGDPSTVAFEGDVPLGEGVNTIAYAVGSVAGGSFQVLTATISGLGSAPGGVPTGTAGLSSDASLLVPLALAGMAVLALSGGALALAKSRR